MHITHRRRWAAGTGMLCLALISTGCRPKQAGPPPAMAPPEVAVISVQPERVSLSSELPGRISACLVADVRPQVGGVIQERRFAEGADVKAGDILYQIDPTMLQAAHDTAKAVLAKAEAALPPIRLRLERLRELVKIKAVSQQDCDDTAAALTLAEADVAVCKAAVETARINLAYTHVTAPISGRIGKSSVTIGALATAYQPVPLASIQQLDSVYVDAPQSSATLLRLKRSLASGNLKSDGAEQAKVKLLLEDGTAYPLEGTLKFSDVTVDPSTGSFILRMVFPNPNGVLLPGMFVRAVVKEGINDQAILIPQQAVSRDPKGNPIALLVDAAGKVVQRKLTLDRALGDRWLLVAGLTPGDRVIVEGMQKARPGVSVNAVPFGDSAKPPTSPAQPAATVN